MEDSRELGSAEERTAASHSPNHCPHRRTNFQNNPPLLVSYDCLDTEPTACSATHVHLLQIKGDSLHYSKNRGQ